MKNTIVFLCTTLISIVTFAQIDPNIDIEGVYLTGGDQLNTITTAVPFLMISPDSKSGAMGDVGVATYLIYDQETGRLRETHLPDPDEFTGDEL